LCIFAIGHFSTPSEADWESINSLRLRPIVEGMRGGTLRRFHPNVHMRHMMPKFAYPSYFHKMMWDDGLGGGVSVNFPCPGHLTIGYESNERKDLSNLLKGTVYAKWRASARKKMCGDKRWTSLQMNMLMAEIGSVKYDDKYPYDVLGV
jgi:hypothetical protein